MTITSTIVALKLAEVSVISWGRVCAIGVAELVGMFAIYLLAELVKASSRRCVRIERLFLGTAHDNMMDKARKGRAANKLTPGLVREIRRLYATGKLYQREIGERFDLDQTTVSDIIRHKIWTWVT